MTLSRRSTARRALPVTAAVLAAALLPSSAFSAASTPAITVTPAETAINSFAVSFAGDSSYDSADVRVCPAGTTADCVVTSKTLAAGQETISAVKVARNGRFDISLRVYDATRRSDWSASSEVTLDRSGPNVALRREFSDYTRTVPFTVADALTRVDEASGGLEYQRPDSTWEPLARATVTAGVLSGDLPSAVAEGAVRIRGALSDAVGNTTTFGPTTVTVDDHAPPRPAAPTSPHAPLTDRSDFQLDMTVPADPGPSPVTGYDIRVCSEPTSCSTHHRPLGSETTHSSAVPVTADGDYDVTIRVRDRAGHIGEWSDALSVARDATAPVLTADPINVAQLRAGEQLTVTASDAFSGVTDCLIELRQDAGDWRPLPSTLNADGVCAAATGKLKRGFYEARATAIDRAGNATHYALPGEIGSMLTVPDERSVPRLELTGLGRSGKHLPVQHGANGGRLVVPVGRPAWVTGSLTSSDGSPMIGVEVAVTETLGDRTRVAVLKTNREGRVRHRLRYVAAGVRVSFVYAGSEARKPAPAVSYAITTSARSTFVLDDIGRLGLLQVSGRIAGRQDLGGMRVLLQTRDSGAKWRTIKVRAADGYGNWKMRATPRRSDKWVRVLLDAPSNSIYADGRSATLALPTFDHGTRR